MSARFTVDAFYRRSNEITPATRMRISRRARVSVVAGRIAST